MSEKSIEQSLADINNKVTSIQQLLQGHELDKDDKGMVGIQNDHERRIGILERKISNGIYFFYGLCITSAWGIADIISKLFTK